MNQRDPSELRNRSAHVVLRVAPGGRRDEIIGRHGEGWKVRVSQPPERGRANEAVCALIARTAECARSDVEVTAGGSGRDKIVRVTGVDFDTLAGMLDAACGN